MKKNTEFEAQIDTLLARIGDVAKRRELAQFAHDFRTRMEDLVKEIALLSLLDLSETREVKQLLAYDAARDRKISKALDSAVDTIVNKAGRATGSV